MLITSQLVPFARSAWPTVSAMTSTSPTMSLLASCDRRATTWGNIHRCIVTSLTEIFLSSTSIVAGISCFFYFSCPRDIPTLESINFPSTILAAELELVRVSSPSAMRSRKSVRQHDLARLSPVGSGTTRGITRHPLYSVKAQR